MRPKKEPKMSKVHPKKILQINCEKNMKNCEKNMKNCEKKIYRGTSVA
jgi:hypothetical protein